jgi:hypothetical protein
LCWAEDRASRPCIGEVVRSLVPPPPLRALVIGINKYKNAGKELQDLNGCVADADDMYQYLTETRGMPSDSILRLNDDAATRAKILEGIRALRDSSAPPDDPIIIFWAGHGARGPAPPGWNTSSLDGEIEMLIPYDFDLKGKGEGASGFLDYQLGRELSELAQAKGDNIVSSPGIRECSGLTCTRLSFLTPVMQDPQPETKVFPREASNCRTTMKFTSLPMTPALVVATGVL